ncbi:MAG: OmpA family protein [Pseudomonadota bacterium]
MKIFSRLALALFLFAYLIAIPAPVLADSQTFNVLFFNPATGRNTYLMLHGTRTLHQLQFDVGNYFSYGFHPLDIRQGNTRLRGVIDHTLVSDFVAAIGATEWLQFGVDVPFVLVNQFRSPTAAAGTPIRNHFDLSDIRFEGKARVLDACVSHVGLAFVPFMTFPTGNDSHYMGDPGFTGGVKIALDGRVMRQLGLTLNVGYQIGRKVVISNLDWQHRLLIGGGIEGNFPQHGLDVFGEINAIAAFNKLFHDRDMNPTEFMAGARWDIKNTGVTLHGGAGTCLVCGVKGARIRGILGVKYRYNPPKMQRLDAQAGSLCALKFSGLTKAQLYELKRTCPPDPADWQQGVHDDACPKYYELRELAGLILRCPTKPEDWQKGIHDEACPKVFYLSDNYNPSDVRNIVAMAVAEMSMVCPANPENWNPQIHDQACPKYYDLEESRILAKKCPSPEKYQAGVDDPKCPKYYTLHDAYGDINWSEVQKLRQIDLDRYGTAIRGGEIQTLRPVYFDFGKSDIRTDAQETLMQVIGVINQTPWVSVVRIGGNTDNVGNPQANQSLSLKRAQNVIDFMRMHGVRSDVQLLPVAYGQYRPVASNDTEEGRALNRRVIFTVSTYKVPKYAPSTKTTTRAKAPEPAPAAEPEAKTIPTEEIEPEKPPTRWE